MPPPLSFLVLVAVRLLRVPFLADVPFLPPHCHLVLLWGASVDLGCSHPYRLAGLEQGVCIADWWVNPPTPSWSGVPPPSLSCRPCASSPCCCLGVSPPSSVPCLCAGGVRCLVRVSPSLPWPRTVNARCWEGGPPYSSIPWSHAGGERCLVGGSPSIPGLHTVGACFWVGGPPPPSPPW